jgi:hypothetical protein
VRVHVQVRLPGVAAVADSAKHLRPASEGKRQINKLAWMPPAQGRPSDDSQDEPGNHADQHRHHHAPDGAMSL